MEITLNNNNQIDFNDSSLKKINLISNEDVLKEQIKEYQLRYPQESGNVRPITALACLKQQIKLNLGNDSDVAKELNSFTRMLNQNEIVQLFSLAIDSIGYPYDLSNRYNRNYSGKFKCFFDFLDGILIDDDSKFEAFLLILESEVKDYDQYDWFWVINKLASIKYKKTEELIIKAIEAPADFYQECDQQQFGYSFFEFVFDICEKNNFQLAAIELFKTLGGYHFYYSGDYGGYSFKDGYGDLPCWDKKYAFHFEAGYRDAVYGYLNDNQASGLITGNRSLFTNTPQNKEMFQRIDEHNSTKGFENIDRHLDTSELDDEYFARELYSNKDFYAMDEAKKTTLMSLYKHHLRRQLKDFKHTKRRIPLKVGYAILSKTYLKDFHSDIYKSSRQLNSPLMALMEKIVLAVYLQKDYKEDSKSLLKQINSLNKEEKDYFKHLFLTQGSGIRDYSFREFTERHNEECECSYCYY